MRGACQVADLTLMIWATRGRSMDGENLIICLAILTLYKGRVPLISDEVQVVSIASRNKLGFALLGGAILEVLGDQNGCQILIFEPFFSMLFCNAFLHRFLFFF